MSQLQRSLMAKSPPAPSPRLDSDSESSASSASSTGTIRPLGAPNVTTHTSTSKFTSMSSSTTQVPWHDYFEQEFYLDDIKPGSKYHVYITPQQNRDKDPIFICHHGAAACGLSFALFAKEIRRLLPSAGILAVDARDHGSVVATINNDETQSFALDDLSDDLLTVMDLTSEKLSPGAPSFSNIVLVGHSLGGSVVTNVANRGVLGSRLIGYAVIDVVEGSALEALTAMQALLSKRPDSFPSVDAAIQWHLRSRTLRNPESARISVPPLLREESPAKFGWKTNLRLTEPYWEAWFKGMSNKFLTGKGAKLLLLAGTDRLDKELMIGQMQGKFQLQVFPETGHFVHEDAPEKTAELVVEFYKRNDRSALVLPPKVSDLLKQGKKV